MSSVQQQTYYNFIVERGRFSQHNYVEMFGGVAPSRGALGLARRALALGQDPSEITQQAGLYAKQEGRNKVGFFGKAEGPLEYLKSNLDQMQTQRNIDNLKRKALKRGT